MKYQRSRQRYELITIKQKPTGSRNENGEYVTGGDNTVDIMASVDPIDTGGLALLRQNTVGGQKISQGIEVFVDVKDIGAILPIRTHENDGSPDLIVWKDITYIVLSVVDYSSDSHFEITAIRLDKQP